MQVDQIYIQLVRDAEEERFLLYSRPPAKDLGDQWSDFLDGYRIGDLYHYEVFQTARRARETVINFLEPDLETETKTVTTVAQPLIQDRVLWGAIIWEVNQSHVLNQTVVPPTFWHARYPFMQIYLPVNPLSGKLGRVLFEYNGRNDALSGINENEEYKAQIRELQKMTYEATQGIQHEFNLTIQEVDYYGVIAYRHEAQFRFRASSLKGENSTFHIPRTRRLADANMIIVMAEDLQHSTQIYIDTARFYVREQLAIFVFATVTMAVGLTVYFVVFNMFLIKILVVNPIVELTDHICNPQDHAKINKFIIQIKKREYERNYRIQEIIKGKERARRRRWYKKLQKMIEQHRAGKLALGDLQSFQRKLEKPIVYVENKIDEVEQIRLLFSQFFKQTTDFSDLDIPSKHENIYNYDEINKSSRKDLIIQNILVLKVVMMSEEEGSRNLMNDQYQYTGLQRTQVRRRLSAQESLAVLADKVQEARPPPRALPMIIKRESAKDSASVSRQIPTPAERSHQIEDVKEEPALESEQYEIPSDEGPPEPAQESKLTSRKSARPPLPPRESESQQPPASKKSQTKSPKTKEGPSDAPSITFVLDRTIRNTEFGFSPADRDPRQTSFQQAPAVALPTFGPLDLSNNGRALVTADPDRIRRERLKTRHQRDLEKENRMRLNQTGLEVTPAPLGMRRRREGNAGETARRRDRTPRREADDEDDGESVDPGTERQPLIASRSGSKDRSKDGRSGTAAAKVRPASSKDRSSKKRDKRSKSKKKSSKKETRRRMKDTTLSGRPPSSLRAQPDPSGTESHLKPRTATESLYEDDDDSMAPVSLPVIPRRQ